jgi:hypothetical protein
MISRVTPILALLLAGACVPASGESGAAANQSATAGAPAQPAGPGNVAAAGHYRLRGEHDTASELDLQPDGHFRFYLAAGALDLHAEGRWTSDGRRVVLNTEPRPTPAVFTPGPVTRTEDSPIVVLVNGANGRGIAGIDLKMGFADGRVIESYTQDYGWQYNQEGPPGVPRWVELSLAMYNLPPQRFPLDAAAGNKFVFTLVPNDLGVQDFHDTVLRVTGEGLVITGPGGDGIYAREGAAE